MLKTRNLRLDTQSNVISLMQFLSTFVHSKPGYCKNSIVCMYQVIMQIRGKVKKKTGIFLKI